MLSFHFYLWGLGLCPADSFDEATADMISDGVTDLFQPLSNMYHEKDETKKVLQKLMSVSVPTYSVVRLYSGLQFSRSFS